MCPALLSNSRPGEDLTPLYHPTTAVVLLSLPFANLPERREPTGVRLHR
jgi:hypothetical protein